MKKSMKKILLLFCMLTCIFSLTACKNEKTSHIAERKLQYNEAELKTSTSSLLQQMSSLSNDDIYNMINSSADITDGYINFYVSWINSRDELGAFKELKQFKANSDKDSITMSATIAYEHRDAVVEIIINAEGDIEGSAFNAEYTSLEKLERAGLNTVIGMGTVFIILIFISLIIWSLKFVNRFEEIRKSKNEITDSQKAVDDAIEHILQNETAEEALNEAEDLELVAAVTAAIAAFEGTSTDGLIVRSIKKVKNRR